MSLADFILYFLISVLPCLTWLLLYLRQDVHPESHKKVIEVFFWGMVMVLPAILLEEFFSSFLPEGETGKSVFLLFFYYIIGVGLVEEFLKYIVVKLRVIDSSHLDEPIDIMLYLIIAGLGFATIENILVIFNITTLEEAAIISTVRLLSAVFIHTLAAAITGYFWAYSACHKRRSLLFFGILIASILHGFYDVSIIKLENTQDLFSFLMPTVIILFMGILVFFFFIKVKKIPRTCKM